MFVPQFFQHCLLSMLVGFCLSNIMLVTQFVIFRHKRYWRCHRYNLTTMSDMVKYRAAIWAFLKLTALYFTMSIGSHWYFDRVFGLQRLKNQSLYNKSLLLQKFTDILGKVLKPKKNPPPTSEKKMRLFFIFKYQIFWDFGLENWQHSLKVFLPTSKM